MDRKLQILEAAGELLQTRSYSSFSYKDLSDVLGITKASIHHHYESKEELGKALVNMYKDKLNILLDGINEQNKTAWKKYDAFINFEKEISQSGTKICPIGSLSAEANVVPESITELICDLCHSIQDWLAEVLKEGRKSGEMIFIGKPKEQALFVEASIQGALQIARLRGPSHFDEIANQLKRSMTP